MFLRPNRANISAYATIRNKDKNGLTVSSRSNFKLLSRRFSNIILTTAAATSVQLVYHAITVQSLLHTYRTVSRCLTESSHIIHNNRTSRYVIPSTIGRRSTTMCTPMIDQILKNQRGEIPIVHRRCGIYKGGRVLADRCADGPWVCFDIKTCELGASLLGCSNG